MWLRDRWREILMLVVVMAVASPLLEGAYRASTIVLHRIAVARDRDALYHIEPGSPLVYRLRANVHGTARFAEDPSREWSYSTNAQGFRGRTLEPRRGDVRRVLALGDSYTFGWGLDDASQTWPGRLEASLQGFEVFNAGVPGYNTVQESHLLDELLARGEVDVVVLAYVVNDAEPQHTVVTDPRVRYRAVRSWLLDRVAKAVNVLLGRPVLPVREYVHSFDYRAGFAPGDVKARESHDALRRIVAQARAHGAAVVVAILPDVTEPFDAAYPFGDIHARVARWAADLDVPVVDLLPTFRGRDHEAYWIPGDGHPNAAAHRLIAETLAPAVASTLP
jgi:lysophospholipase L1-like esterase